MIAYFPLLRMYEIGKENTTSDSLGSETLTNVVVVWEFNYVSKWQQLMKIMRGEEKLEETRWRRDEGWTSKRQQELLTGLVGEGRGTSNERTVIQANQWEQQLQRKTIGYVTNRGWPVGISTTGDGQRGHHPQGKTSSTRGDNHHRGRPEGTRTTGGDKRGQ